MDLTKIKVVTELQLEGITIELLRENDKIKGMTLKDAQGRYIHIKQPSTYEELEILIPTPPKKVERWALKGMYLGMYDLCEYFEQEHKAESRRLDLANNTIHSCEEIGLTIEKVTVLMDDIGNTKEVPDDGAPF